jgi:DNA-binding response OmpR family regulator
MTGREVTQLVALVVEQDYATREFLVDNLSADGFDAHAAVDAEAGLAAVRELLPDVAIVGVNGGTGREFARQVRAGRDLDHRLPMVLLGGDSHELDTLRAFDAGADDYVPKPFIYTELHARVKALMRRVEMDRPGDEKARKWQGLVIDKAKRAVWLDGKPIEPLTQREWALLWSLAGEPERVWTKAELQRMVWPANSASSRTLDCHACRLRSKLGPDWVVNVWGVGYALGRRGR